MHEIVQRDDRSTEATQKTLGLCKNSEHGLKPEGYSVTWQRLETCSKSRDNLFENVDVCVGGFVPPAKLSCICVLYSNTQ